ncbi:MAG: HEAT repeat domain-containing protein [Anaerolineaceae bacterium]|nr:HEAT repeat domain-containing protein [Anaerolineaceae bacterium]
MAALLDDKNFFPPSYLHHLSDLEGADLESLRSVWPQASPNRRFTLLEDLEELAEEDTLVSYDSIARMALQDEDPRVRTIAVRLLWEADDPKLAQIFIKMVHEDPEIQVRAAVATALGMFVYLGELEEISKQLHHKIEDLLLQIVNGTDDILVRRRALESLGFSGRKEVPSLIRMAYENGDISWLASALFAMGRSADESWAPEVLRMLRHQQTSVQLEAIRAAGELTLDSARRPILLLLDDELLDSEIRAAIYWSLSKIGGDDVRETLEEHLEQTEDDEEAEIIEDALENLDFTEELNMFEMLDLDDLPSDDETAEEYLIRHKAPLLDENGINIPVDDEDSPSTPALEDEAEDNEDTQQKPSSGNKRHRHRRSG